MKKVAIIGSNPLGGSVERYNNALEKAIEYCEEHDIEIVHIPDGENISHGLPISEPEPMILTIPDRHLEPIPENYLELISEPKRKNKLKKVNNTFGKSKYF